MRYSAINQALIELTGLYRTIPVGSANQRFFAELALIIVHRELEMLARDSLTRCVCNSSKAGAESYVGFLVRNQPISPEKLMEALVRIDKQLKTPFNQRVSKTAKQALTNLRSNRNAAAHGGSVAMTFEDVKRTYILARQVVSHFCDLLP